jgi:dTDP-4-dehydrorhamnose reductase
MRVLVLGAGGQLGRELSTLRSATVDIIGLAHAECDIAEPGETVKALASIRPQAVINCAAWTKVDAAESNQEAAFRVNATGPLLLARACTAAGVLLCHVSTDYVFDGTASEPVPETATTHPLGVYGASKLAGENAVRENATRHLIVRTAWLYGQDGPNFVLTMLRLGAEGRDVRVVADQRGTPTWTGHVAPALLRLVAQGRTGVYHLTNDGETTWHGFAAAIMAEAGIHANVIGITTAEYGAPAPRPAYSVLDNRAWRDLDEAPLPPWEHGLRAYLFQRGVVASGTDAAG